MKTIREYAFPELGYFTEDTCERIKATMDNRTYMNFRVSWSNHAGNCTLMIYTDYEDTEEHIKQFFLYAALCEIGR
jgi:hypothetical protein